MSVGYVWGPCTDGITVNQVGFHPCDRVWVTIAIVCVWDINGVEKSFFKTWIHFSVT